MAPRDKYNNLNYWPEGFGNLDNHGRLRMFKLGKFIRSRYNDFIGDNMRKIYSRSSDVERCIESSLALLAGLYKPHDKKIWTNELPWVPVPVHSTPPSDDYILNEAGSKVIDLFHEELAKVQENEVVKKLYDVSTQDRELLERENGNDFDHFVKFKCTFSCLDIEQRNGYEMPAWYTPELKKRLYNYAGLAFSLAASGTQKLLKLRSCCLLKDMVDRMEAAEVVEADLGDKLSEFAIISSTAYYRKIVHYSTHDSIIAVMLDALNLNGKPDPIPPAFGATFFFELYADVDEAGNQVGEKYLKIFYLDNTESELPIEKTLPDCKLNEKGQLTLSSFKQYISHLLPGDKEFDFC